MNREKEITPRHKYKTGVSFYITITSFSLHSTVSHRSRKKKDTPKNIMALESTTGKHKSQFLLCFFF